MHEYEPVPTNSRIFFIQDNATGQEASNAGQGNARRIFNARNEAHQQPAIICKIARAYLMASDPRSCSARGKTSWDQSSDRRPGFHKTATFAALNPALRQPATPKLREPTPRIFSPFSRTSKCRWPLLATLHNLALNLGWLPVPVFDPQTLANHSANPSVVITPENISASWMPKKCRAKFVLPIVCGKSRIQSDAPHLPPKTLIGLRGRFPIFG